MDQAERWPALLRDDEGLLEEIQATLTSRVQGDPYSSDGSFSQNLSSLPKGLRAMAATHWLDISLTLDSITWHFGNFGEPALVAQTEEGLLELGLDELAWVFREARILMAPFIDQMSPEQPPDELLEKAGLGESGDRIDRKAWELADLGTGKSAIYDAWIRYARSSPELVFGS
jgi:hypothetical protein